MLKGLNSRKEAIREINHLETKRVEIGISTTAAAGAAGRSTSTLTNRTADIYSGSPVVNIYAKHLDFSQTTKDPTLTTRGVQVAQYDRVKLTKNTKEEVEAEIMARGGEPINKRDQKITRQRLTARKHKEVIAEMAK